MTENQLRDLAEKSGMCKLQQNKVDELKKFYELAVVDEREACAQFLESTQLGSLPNDTALHYARLLKGFAEGIRARGQA